MPYTTAERAEPEESRTPPTSPEPVHQPVPPVGETAVAGLKRTVLVCPDSFKGTLTAVEAAEAMARGVRAAWHDADVIRMPLADGGEGTLHALMEQGGTLHTMTVEGPDGAPVDADWGILPDGTAVIEMAQASGLGYVLPVENDLQTATTCGTGQLIRAALKEGCKRFIVGIGGSATNDGGMGALRALGARFLDKDGKELCVPGELLTLDSIDLSGFVDIADTSFIVACDVTNPLCGPNGATFIFGPQKGGMPAVLWNLEAALQHFAYIVKETLGKDASSRPGAGAAGGLGFALLAFLDATFAPGADLVMNVAGFDEAAKRADVIVTGEGRLDDTSFQGKLVCKVLQRSQGKPVAIVCGTKQISKNVAVPHVSETILVAPADKSGIDPLLYPSEAVERTTRDVLQHLE